MQHLELTFVGQDLEEPLTASKLLSPLQVTKAITTAQKYPCSVVTRHLTVYEGSKILTTAEDLQSEANGATVALALLGLLHRTGSLHIAYINGVQVPETSNPEREKLADDLGQIIFRLETNYDFLQHRLDNRNTAGQEVQDCRQRITTDLERLKDIKYQIHN